MKKYTSASELTKYPFRKNIDYKCLKCGDIIPSDPPTNVHCTCRNIMIDRDAGRMKVNDPSQVQMIEEIPN